MHSSRMCTARSLTDFPGSLPSLVEGGVVVRGMRWSASGPPLGREEEVNIPTPPQPIIPYPTDHVTYPLMH